MTVGNQLRIQEPTADLLDWCKKNMVLANPDYAKKVRMHLWLGNTPQKLYLMQWDGDTLVEKLRDGISKILRVKLYGLEGCLASDDVELRLIRCYSRKGTRSRSHY